jgi:hypothetical protein
MADKLTFVPLCVNVYTSLEGCFMIPNIDPVSRVFSQANVIYRNMRNRTVKSLLSRGGFGAVKGKGVSVRLNRVAGCFDDFASSDELQVPLADLQPAGRG